MDCPSCRDALANQLISSAGPCATDLCDIIESAWDTAAIEACGNDRLHFYVAKRNAVLALMGCEAYSTDEAFRQTQADSITKANSLSTLRSQQQSTGSTNRFARSHGESVFNEKSYARSTGDMDRHARSTETGDGRSTYRDDSRGNGFNNSDSLRTVIGDGEELTTRQVAETRTERGSRVDCNFESSYNTTNTVNGVVGFPPLVIVAGDVTASRNEWRKFINRSENDTMVHTRFESTVSDAFRETNGTGNSTHTWLSQFFTDTEQHSLDTDIRVSRDRSDSRRHSEAQAVGNGNGLSEAKVESNSSAQGTLLSQANTNATATTTSTYNATGYTLANSQRFRNLRLLYDQLQARITREKWHIKMSQRALIATQECTTLCSATHKNARYSQLAAAGMCCYEATCSPSWTTNAVPEHVHRN